MHIQINTTAISKYNKDNVALTKSFNNEVEKIENCMQDMRKCMNPEDFEYFHTNVKKILNEFRTFGSDLEKCNQYITKYLNSYERMENSYTRKKIEIR